MNIEAMPKCPQCGAQLPSDAPDGLCPNCLMAMNLKTETVFTGDSPAAQPPLPPEQIAPHFPQLEILECLGRGGMGVVYKARQKTLNRFVALKLLAPERVRDVKFAERFTREAQALAALNHPNIVTIYDFGQAGGFYFLLMEFVDGVNLRQLLRARKFTPEEALTIVPPLCDALQFAHERGIVHRDIKPENLLLDKTGRVKVADFGIAKMLGADNGGKGSESIAPENATQNAVGTPGYSAPEQKSDPQRVDSRADIYSLGVVFYEMLTGELPGKKIEAPSKKVQIDVRLDEVVLRALEKTPELRWQTAADLRTRVETIASTASEEQPKAAQSGVPILRWCDRWIWDTQNLILMGFVPGMISAMLATSLPFFGTKFLGTKCLLALIPGGLGLVFTVVYAFVGSRIRKLKARLPKSDAEVAEALIFERPRQTPGIALLHADRLELHGIALIGELVIPLKEIASVSEVRWFNGRRLWWKSGFVLDLKNGRRIGVAMPEPFARRWRAKLGGGTLPELPAESESKNEPRFSRAAIAGACWAGLAAVAAIWFGILNGERVGVWREMSTPGKLGFVLTELIGMAGWSATLGTTILGWIAVAQIRREAGKIYGLGLAVFDGLFFPLLVLDVLVFAVVGNVVPQSVGSEITIMIFGVTILGLGWLDFLVIRRVWRAVKQPLDGSPNIPPAKNSSGQTLAGLALFFAGLSGVLGTLAFYLMPKTFPVLDWSILLAALLGIFLGILTREKRHGKSAIVVGSINTGIWLIVFAIFNFHSEKFDYIGQSSFPYGDSIEITSVSRNENQMIVRGHYHLVSHDSAQLALYITSSPTNNPPDDSRQWTNIVKGSGGFELTHPHLHTGLPHVSMYSTNGHGFAGVYFGNKEEAAEESKMDLSHYQNGGGSAKPVAAQNLSFGAVREQTVNSAIDFDTGNLFEMPEKFSDDFDENAAAAVVWMQQHGVDADWDGKRFLCFGMRSLPLLYTDWETLSPVELARKIESPDTNALSQATMTPLIVEDTGAGEVVAMIISHGSRAENRPQPTQLPSDKDVLAWGFKTREGGMGILQITGFDDHTRSVKIRYKLVQPSSQVGTRTSAAVEDSWRTVLTLEGSRFEVTQSDEPLRNVSLTNAITVKSVAWQGWSDSGAPAAQVEIRLPEDVRWKWYWQMRVFDRAGREYSPDQFKPQVTNTNEGIDVNCVAEIYKVATGDVEKILLQCRPFP